MTSSTKWVIGVGVLLLLVAAGIGVTRHVEDKLIAAQLSVTAAHQAEVLAVQKADSENAAAQAAVARAEQESLARVAADKRAQTASTKAAAAEADFSTKAAAAADTCRVVIQSARVALAQKDSVSQLVAASRDSAVSAEQNYKLGFDSVSVALARVRDAAKKSDQVAQTLVKASKSSVLGRLLPQPMVGALLGVDQTGHVAAAFGIGFGWRL